MALTIEDGSQVAGANTYVSDSEYTAYAYARGKAIGHSPEARERELILAKDYLESFRYKFKGSKVASDQALQWPRTGVYIDGFSVDSDTIPDDLKNAQIEAAILINSEELLKTGTTQNIQREKLGELEVTYFSNGSFENVRTDTVDIYLQALIGSGNNGFSFEVNRG